MITDDGIVWKSTCDTAAEARREFGYRVSRCVLVAAVLTTSLYPSVLRPLEHLGTVVLLVVLLVALTTYLFCDYHLRKLYLAKKSERGIRVDGNRNQISWWNRNEGTDRMGISILEILSIEFGRGKGCRLTIYGKTGQRHCVAEYVGDIEAFIAVVRKRFPQLPVRRL